MHIHLHTAESDSGIGIQLQDEAGRSAQVVCLSCAQLVGE